MIDTMPKKYRSTRYFIVLMREFVLVMLMGFLPVRVWGMVASTGDKSPWEKNAFHLYFGTSLTSEGGHMTYTIQGTEEGGWKSKLEWPLEGVLYGGGVVSINFWKRGRLNVGVWKNLTDKAGIMTDTDWFDNYSALFASLYGDEKAVYGEFDSTVEAMQIDANMRFSLLRNRYLSLGALAGYSWRTWEWKTGNGYQYSHLSSYNVGSINRTGIIYEEELKVPYMGLAVSAFSRNSRVGFNLYSLYSPFAECDDDAEHLLRYKESIGTTSGTFFAAGADLFLKFGHSWSVIGTIDYALYDLEGKQDQIFYSGDNMGTHFEDIEMEIQGQQLSFGFLLGYTL